MSRKVDPNSKSLSDADKLYLAQRGQLSTDVMPADEQRQLLDLDSNIPTLEQRANTGDVNTANMSIEQLETELKRRRAEAAAVDTSTLFGSKSGPADDDEDDDDVLEPPYAREGVTKRVLIAEIERRNQGRAEEDQLSPVGNKEELIAALEADDEDSDEDESE